MALEDRAAFFYTTVVSAPTNPLTGTDMITDDLTNAPAFPFHAVIRPANQVPASPDIGEVILVTDYDDTTGELTMTRDVLGQGAISIANGYVMYQYLGKTLDILEFCSQILINRLPANFDFTGTAAITGFNIPFTLPTSLIVIIDLDIDFSHNAFAGVDVDDVMGVYPRVDGVALEDCAVRYQVVATSADLLVHRRATIELPAGAHTITAETRMFVGNGQGTISASSTMSVEFRNSGNETAP